MKNRKLIKALAALTLSAAAASCITLFGCGGGGSGHSHKYSDEYKWDETGHWHECTSNDGGKTKVEPHEFTDDYDPDCNVDGCGYTREVPKEYWTVTIDMNDGSEPTTKQVEKGQKLTGVSPKRDGYEFMGWKVNGEAWSINTPITDNITIVAQWEVAYDTITTTWDFLAGASRIKANPSGQVPLTEDMTFQGKFMLSSGARFEINATDASKNIINTQGKTIEFTLSGDGTNNAFAINASWASSTKTGKVTVTNKATGATVYESNVLNNNDSVNASANNLPAGTYVVTTEASIKITSFVLTEKLQQSPITGIELDTAGVVANVLLGRAFSADGLTVKLAYENGRRDVLELSDKKIKVEAPEDFTTSAGAKTITVKYTLDDTTTYTKTYTVNVCAVSSLVYYDYTLSVNRITNNLQTVFALNGTFNHDNLVVKAKCEVPGSSGKYVEFKLNSNEFAVEETALTTAGNKTVTIKYSPNNAITAAYEIEVVAIPDLSEVTSVTVNVDPDADISATGSYNFNTINQALQFLKLANVADGAEKIIALKAGTVYHEKVEIDMKNVVLTTADAEFDAGENFSYATANSKYNNFAVIEYGALNGVMDPSETITHSTDGSATVSIRPEAENFVAKFVTFKNTYNTKDLYQQSLTITTDSQAVAALVQADKATFVGCKFTSYHDTLYAQVGRQYYDHCYIEGHTDYIFGYNATAYFESCLIRSIGAGATKEENSNYNNGGYVVATKGHNKGADTDGITYGYIFNHCEFTGDDNTADGSVSMARGWDTSMRMMVMNSSISAKFSKEAYGEKTANEPNNKDMNDRYGKMSKDPVAEQLLEYNNTGDGAISASIANTCTVATAAVAANYADLNKVFNPVNGNMKYADAWNPAAAKNVTVVLKTTDDTVVQTMTAISWSGSVVTKAMLDGALAEGVKVEGYYSDKACTTAYDFTTTLAEGEKVIYVKVLAGDAKMTETFNASTTGFTASTDSSNGKASGTSLKDNAYNGTSFNLVAGGSGDTKAGTLSLTATANDESGLTFNTAFVPGGSGRTYTITAIKDVKITVYFTVSNSAMCGATAAATKDGELTVDGETVTDSGKKSNNVAYAYVLNLTAGQEVVIGTSSSSNSLVIFGLVAEY